MDYSLADNFNVFHFCYKSFEHLLLTVHLPLSIYFTYNKVFNFKSVFENKGLRGKFRILHT